MAKKKKKAAKKAAKKTAKKAALKKTNTRSKKKAVKTASSKKAARKAPAKKKVTKQKAAAKKKATKAAAKKVKPAAKKLAAKPPKKAEAKSPKKAAAAAPKKSKQTEEVLEAEDILTDDELDSVQQQIDEVKAEDVILTDAEGNRYCRVRDCDQLANVDAYCRYHYLLFWKKIQVRKKILTEGKLQKYIEDLTARYPDKFLEILRKDLRSEKDFLAAIMELELDESSSEDANYEDEDRSFIDEVRGVTESAGRSARDDDDY